MVFNIFSNISHSMILLLFYEKLLLRLLFYVNFVCTNTPICNCLSLISLILLDQRAIIWCLINRQVNVGKDAHCSGGSAWQISWTARKLILPSTHPVLHCRRVFHLNTHSCFQYCELPSQCINMCVQQYFLFPT